MPHHREDQATRSDPPITGDGGSHLPDGTLPAPGTPEPTLSGLQEDARQAGGRVDAAEAVTGSRPVGEGAGEAPPDGHPGDDASMEAGDSW